MIDAPLKTCRNCDQPNPRRIFGVKIGTNEDRFRIICDNCDNASEIYSNEQEMIDAWNHRCDVIIESEDHQLV